MPKRTGRHWREHTVPRILRRDGGICHLCAQPGADTADHLVPWSQGGTDEPSNLAAAHKRCNQLRGTTDIDKTRQRLAATTHDWDW
jgi:5-methylcytosine-specific restriction endonuclease McrA